MGYTLSKKSTARERCFFVMRAGEALRLGGGLFAGGLCGGKRVLGRDGEGGEAGGVVGGDVGEDLAIEGVAGELETVDEGRVAHAVEAAGGVDTDDPESAILALLLLTAGVGEHESALDGLLCCLIELGFREEVTTRALQDLFAAVVTLSTPFYTGHGDLLLRTSF